jgi:hypothetical protein
MAELSVTEVQAHLRNFAESGHDVISRPGSFMLKGKPFMSYGSGLYLPSHKRTGNISLTNIIPVGESGNVAEVNMWHTKHLHELSNLRDASYWVPEDWASEQVALLHPKSVTESSTGETHHSYDLHPEQSTYFQGRDYEGDFSQSRLPKAVQEMGKAEGHYRTATVEDIAHHRGTAYPVSLSELKNHNPAKASWHVVAYNMHVPSQIPHIPEKTLPAGLDIRNLGQFVHVFDDTTGSSYLYHPESEKMAKIK